MSEDEIPQPGDPETELVRAWRIAAGMALRYEWADAVKIADSQIDLHALADLLEAGCPPLTAISILI